MRLALRQFVELVIDEDKVISAYVKHLDQAQHRYFIICYNKKDCGQDFWLSDKRIKTIKSKVIAPAALPRWPTLALSVYLLNEFKLLNKRLNFITLKKVSFNFASYQSSLNTFFRAAMGEKILGEINLLSEKVLQLRAQLLAARVLPSGPSSKKLSRSSKRRLNQKFKLRYPRGNGRKYIIPTLIPPVPATKSLVKKS